MNISLPDSNSANRGSSPGAALNHASNLPIVPAGRMLPFALVTALFFLWGVPHNLNDILIRQFMKSFEINRLQAGLIQSAFYMGYFLLAIPAGAMMRRAGYKAGILTGLCLYGAGCFLFWPAAIVQQYWFFLMALFVIASGLAFLETASSPFIAQLGDPETSDQRLNLAQAFNPLGSISAVLVGSQFIFSGVELKPAEIAVLKAHHQYQDYLRSETLRVIVPYVVIGAVVLLWALLIARTPFPHTGMDFSRATLEKDHSKPVWLRKHFICAVIALFLYVGAQVGVWSYLISYMQVYTNTTERAAGIWLTVGLGLFAVGRFGTTVLMRYISAARLLAIFAIVNTAAVSLAAFQPGWFGVGCLMVVALFMSMMFPTIFAMGLKGLGTRTKTGGSILVMAIIGGAVITPLMGKVADTSGVAMGFLVPAACFVGVLLYAIFGSQPSPGDMDAA